MRPAIGITCDYDLGISSQSISPGRSYFFSNKNYAQAVEKSGGLPLLLPCLSSEEIVEAFLDKIDGLLLSGGVDIDPSYYGEEPDPRLGGLNPERAAFEVMIIQRALERDLPLLGICGGYQLLNVVAEGSLYQDIYSQVPQVLNHRQRAPRWYPYHTVQIEKESKLRQILRIDSLRVNSRHHQAVKNLGKDFKVSASTSKIFSPVLKSGNIYLMLSQHCPDLPNYPRLIYIRTDKHKARGSSINSKLINLHNPGLILAQECSGN